LIIGTETVSTSCVPIYILNITCVLVESDIETDETYVVSVSLGGILYFIVPAPVVGAPAPVCE